MENYHFLLPSKLLNYLPSLCIILKNSDKNKATLCDYMNAEGTLQMRCILTASQCTLLMVPTLQHFALIKALVTGSRDRCSHFAPGRTW